MGGGVSCQSVLGCARSAGRMACRLLDTWLNKTGKAAPGIQDVAKNFVGKAGNSWLYISV